jgi:2-polyprenyl-3-methyl-5-hydroxy-6-metoxy-1,4-benzoquinol methylase
MHDPSSSPPSEEIYTQALAQEAQVWGAEANELAQRVPPDWQAYRRIPELAVVEEREIARFLERIQPGMRVLELGCNAGALTVALARRGAQVEGLDISTDALEIARNYYETIKDSLPGQASYAEADLNRTTLPEATYDVICVKGTLHHLPGADDLLGQVERALKPGGLLWVMDSIGRTPFRAVLLASALTFVLPTKVSYREKFVGLRRFGLNAPARVQASIEADGLSPFEGVGREVDWLAVIREQFAIEREVINPSVVGYVAAQIRLPDRIAWPLLRALRAFENLLIRLRLLDSSALTVYARKPVR